MADFKLPWVPEPLWGRGVESYSGQPYRKRRGEEKGSSLFFSYNPPLCHSTQLFFRL